MKIEVLGPGCPRCEATKKVIKRVIKDLQVDAEVVAVYDIGEIIERGVMATPAVFIDGELKCTGRVPLKEEVEAWFSGRTVNNPVQEQCTCLYYAMEQAKMIKKEPSLYKLICKSCGISFSSNVQKDYCFECEKKRR